MPLSTNGGRINECRRALAPRCPYPDTLTVTFHVPTFARSHVRTFARSHVPRACTMPLSTNGERINEWVAPRMRVADFLDLCSCVCIYRLREHEIARLGDYVIVSFPRSPVLRFTFARSHVPTFARSHVRTFPRSTFHVCKTLEVRTRANHARRPFRPSGSPPALFYRQRPQGSGHVPTFHVPTFHVLRSTFHVLRSTFHVSSAATHRSAANPSP